MKQVSVYDFHTLGQALHSLRELSEETTERGGIWTGHRAHEQLLRAQSDSVLLPASRDAAKELVAVLEGIFGKEIHSPLIYAFGTPDPTEKLCHRPKLIDSAIGTFEAVLRADLPRMTVQSVEHMGIDQADEYSPESIRERLSSQARTDIVLAGKCLAFDVHTTSAFHMERALEIVYGSL